MDSKNGIVKFDNSMNLMDFKGFTSLDIDFFWACCLLLQRDETLSQKVDMADFKRTLGLQKKANAEIYTEIENMAEKLANTVSYKGKNEKGFRHSRFTHFFEFEMDEELMEIEITMNPKFKDLLFNLVDNYTKADFYRLRLLKNKYSKKLYLRLCQYRRTGKYRIDVEDFRRVLDCPDSYENKHFNKMCVVPAFEELKENSFFDDLEFTPIKGSGKGAPLKGYEFNFKKSEQTPGQLSIPGTITGSASKGQKKTRANFTQRSDDFNAIAEQIMKNQN